MNLRFESLVNSEGRKTLLKFGVYDASLRALLIQNDAKRHFCQAHLSSTCKPDMQPKV